MTSPVRQVLGRLLGDDLKPLSVQVQERKAKGLHPVNELQRFRILVCCFFCSICVSLTFAFELLSTQFRRQFQLSPGDMSTISTVGLALCYFSLPYSIVYENFGPAMNFLICGVTGFIGAVCLGLTFQGKMGGNLATITVFYALMNISAGLFDVSYISVLFEVFPRNRGPVIGLSKVMTGLGMSFFSCLCNTIFGEDVGTFVYFLAVFVVVVSVISAVLVRLPPYHINYWRRRGKTPEQIAELVATKTYYSQKFVPKKRLFIGYGVGLAMIVFYAIEAPVIAYTANVSRGGKIAVGIVAILLVLGLFIPLLPIPALGGMHEMAPAALYGDEISVAEADDQERKVRDTASEPHAVPETAALDDDVEMSPRIREGPAGSLGGGDDRVADDELWSNADSIDLEEAAHSRQDPRYTADSWLGYLKQADLWLLLAYLFLVQPMGIMVSFNSSTISIALTGVVRSDQLSTLYSAFLGVGNSMGRILFGLFEGYVQHQDPANRKVLITVSMFFVPIVGSIAGILVQVMPGNSILLPFIMVYVQSGFTSALAALIFTSLFEKFHNALYCTGCFTFVADVVLFNRLLFGMWADRQHSKLNLDESVECNQAVCVRMPLIVVTAMCAASSAVALILHIRYSRYVHRIRQAAQSRKDAFLDNTAREADAIDETHGVRERKAKGLHPVNEMHRFYILVCCFFCSTTVSVTYAYDLFTDTFQSQFGLSSGDLTTVSTVGLVFCYFTIPYSFIYENLGPYLLFWVCCLCALIGGLCLALTVDGKIHGSTATLSVFYAFLNVASGLVDTAYVCTLAELFPRNRGPVIALAKVMTSLGASTLSCVFSSFFGDNMAGFIYFLMAFVMVVDIWASFTIVLPPYYMNWWRRRGKTEEEIFELRITGPYYERKVVPIPRMIIGYTVVVLLIIFYAVESPVVTYTYSGPPPLGVRVAIGVIGVVLVLAVFLMILPLPFLGGMNEPAPVGVEKRNIEAEFRAVYARQLALTHSTSEELPEWLQEDDVDEHPGAKALQNLTPSDSNEQEQAVSDELEQPLASANAAEDYESRQDPRYRGTFLDYCLNVDMWLIMLLFVCYSVTGTLVMYNSSTISIAMNGYARSSELSALYTAFLGVGSAVGRIAFGMFEAYVQHQKPGHRKVIITMALPFSPFLSFLGSLFILVLPAKAILFPFILVYLEEGVFAGVNALIFPCLFEMNHNSLYNMSFLIQMVSIICFNRVMFGTHVDNQEEKYRANGRIPASAVGCTIPECVRMPLIVACVLGFCGIFVAVGVHLRYKRFIKRVLREKEEAKAQGVPYVPDDGSSALSRWVRSKVSSRKSHNDEYDNEPAE